MLSCPGLHKLLLLSPSHSEICLTACLLHLLTGHRSWAELFVQLEQRLEATSSPSQQQALAVCLVCLLTASHLCSSSSTVSTPGTDPTNVLTLGCEKAFTQLSNLQVRGWACPAHQRGLAWVPVIEEVEEVGQLGGE